MARLFRLLLLGLVLVSGGAGCKKDARPATAPPPGGPPQRSMQSPKLIPLPP
jgi:hypothetical protein